MGELGLKIPSNRLAFQKYFPDFACEGVKRLPESPLQRITLKWTVPTFAHEKGREANPPRSGRFQRSAEEKAQSSQTHLCDLQDKRLLIPSSAHMEFPPEEFRRGEAPPSNPNSSEKKRLIFRLFPMSSPLPRNATWRQSGRRLYPLGSCTMKYNPMLNDWAAGSCFSQVHPPARRRLPRTLVGVVRNTGMVQKNHRALRSHDQPVEPKVNWSASSSFKPTTANGGRAKASSSFPSPPTGQIRHSGHGGIPGRDRIP